MTIETHRSPREKLFRRLKRKGTPLATALLYPLSKFASRSPRRWVFGHAGDAFMGNPKYLFLWIAIHRPDLRVTWITGNEHVRRTLVQGGYDARRRWSFAGVIATLRALVFVFGHGLGNVNAHLSGGAYLLNLWHGVGLKSIHLGWTGGKTARAERERSGLLARLATLEYLRPYDALITTSDMMQAHFAEQTRLPPERCPQLGYPRLDCASDPALLAAAEALDRAQGFEWPTEFSEHYIYMPTFRDTGRPFLDTALPDMARLSAVLAKRGALLWIKPHPRTQAAIEERYANIRRWDDRVDPNTYLARFTGLITDYSSVLYDYLYLHDTGAILYTFDYNTYVGGDRTLVHSFADNVAGLQVGNFDDLCTALRDGTSLDRARLGDVVGIRDRFWGSSAPPASERVVAWVEQDLIRRDRAS